MSSKARLAEVLESILDRLDSLDAKISGLDGKMSQCISVAIDARAEVDTLRVRVLDESNRAGVRHMQLVKRVEVLEAEQPRAAE